MATRTVGDKAKWRRRKSTKYNDDDNDCASLAWLLNFRLDEIVNVKVPEEVKTSDGPPVVKKPPYTYPELIERALREKGELTVSAIYQWISDRFPYYKANEERWKNSVRHNLSINPHFRKGARASQGAGHLWSLAANAIDLLPLRREHEKTELIHEAHVIECPKEIALANAISLPMDKDSIQTEVVDENHIIEYPKVIVLDEAAIAAASIIPDQDIFNGGTMFLNPVSTEQVVRECGLITSL